MGSQSAIAPVTVDQETGSVRGAIQSSAAVAGPKSAALHQGGCQTRWNSITDRNRIRTRKSDPLDRQRAHYDKVSRPFEKPKTTTPREEIGRRTMSQRTVPPNCQRWMTSQTELVHL